MTFYVYTLIDPRSGSVFYVGKGKGSRVSQHEAEARRGKYSRKCNLIREIWGEGLDVERRIVERFADEDAAFEREIEMIANIGLANLTNVLPGGQGKSSPNAMTPDEIKARYKEQRLRPRIEALARKFVATALFQFERDGAEMGRVFVSALRSLVGGAQSEPWKPKEIRPFTVLGRSIDGPSALEVLLEIASNPSVARGIRMDAVYVLSSYCRPHGAR